MHRFTPFLFGRSSNEEKRTRARITSLILSTAFLLSACSPKSTEESVKHKKVGESTSEESSEATATTEPTETTAPRRQSVRDMQYDSDGHALFSMMVFELAPDYPTKAYNDIQMALADKTNAIVFEDFPSTMWGSDYVQNAVGSGDCDDFIYGDDYTLTELMNEGFLVPWDDYLNDPAYSNLRSLYSDAEWELFRQPDGHIYWVDPDNHIQGKDTRTDFTGGAFWIQVRVLEWAEYPVIETVEEYFDLLERYYQEHQSNEDGTKIIPFTILCEDWRFYCANNPALLTAGEPYDSCIIDTTHYSDPTAVDYAILDSTREYYRIINDAFNSGLIEKDFKTQKYQQYIDKILSGAVLGMFDEGWDFNYDAVVAFKANGFSELGYDYVPLALTITPDMENHYYIPRTSATWAMGYTAVTTACPDPDAAFAFMNALLEDDAETLRFWGIKGEDYDVDDSGLYYRTTDQSSLWMDPTYCSSHACSYYYLPHFHGVTKDGLNSIRPEEQPSEYFKTISEPLQKCLEAYGCSTFPEMLHSTPLPDGWAPIYDYVNNNMDGPASRAYDRIMDMKRTYIPKLIMCSPAEYDMYWNDYYADYRACQPEPYIGFIQEYLDSLT